MIFQDRLIKTIGSFWAQYRLNREIRRRVAELSQLSQHELKDIGIHSSEIQSYAMGRERRKEVPGLFDGEQANENQRGLECEPDRLTMITASRD